MALSLESISAKARVRAPRTIILGTEKIGKTCFACGCSYAGDRMTAYGQNHPVVMPVKGEEGVDSLEVPAFPTLGSYGQILEALGILYTEDHDHRTVVIDSASALEPLIWDDLCQRHNVNTIDDVGGGYGKGYTEALGSWRQLLDGLDALRSERGMASIIIGHVKVKRFDDPGGDSYDQYQFDIHDKAANLLFRWADLILFANTKVVVRSEDVGFGQKKKRGVDAANGQRFLFTKKRPAHPGGGRGIYGQLPYELPLDWAAFESAVSNAMNPED